MPAEKRARTSIQIQSLISRVRIMKYQHAVLAVLLSLWSGLPSLGHHAPFYKTIFAAIDHRDLASAKHLFSEGAWNGQASDVSGMDLARRLKASKSFWKYETTSNYVRGQAPHHRTAIYLKIVYQNSQEPGHFWFLADGKPTSKDPDAHSVLRITNNILEAERFLNRKLPAAK